MKLIGTPISPYTRKARVVLAEKRIEYEFVVDAPYDAATNVTSFNPLGKVPVLVLDDATTIFDSRVIVEYLDNASPVTKLLPEDTRHRIQARRWEAIADGCTDACVAIVMERRRPEAFQYGEWVARQQGKVERALDAMSDDLGNRSWCCGDFFNLSDVAVGSASSTCACLKWRGARNIRTWRASRRSSRSGRRSGIRCPRAPNRAAERC
jgi:glutathione S-transferase